MLTNLFSWPSITFTLEALLAFAIYRWFLRTWLAHRFPIKRMDHFVHLVWVALPAMSLVRLLVTGEWTITSLVCCLVAPAIMFFFNRHYVRLVSKLEARIKELGGELDPNQYTKDA